MRNEKVQLAIIVVVNPRRTGCKSRTRDAGTRGDIGELAIAKVAVEMARSHCSDIQVVIAVVVEISDRAAHPVHLNRESRLARNVREGTVMIVVVERGIELPRLVL